MLETVWSLTATDFPARFYDDDERMIMALEKLDGWTPSARCDTQDTVLTFLAETLPRSYELISLITRCD